MVRSSFFLSFLLFLVCSCVERLDVDPQNCFNLTIASGQHYGDQSPGLRRARTDSISGFLTIEGFSPQNHYNKITGFHEGDYVQTVLNGGDHTQSARLGVGLMDEFLDVVLYINDDSLPTTRGWVVPLSVYDHITSPVIAPGDKFWFALTRNETSYQLWIEYLGERYFASYPRDLDGVKGNRWAGPYYGGIPVAEQDVIITVCNAYPNGWWD